LSTKKLAQKNAQEENNMTSYEEQLQNFGMFFVHS